MKINAMNTQKQNGISLVEILIVMTLGGVLLNTVIQMFLSSTTASRTVVGSSSMHDNARTALDDLITSLRFAGHYGGIKGNDIEPRGNVAVTGIGGCNQAWIFNTNEPIRGYQGAETISGVAGLPSGCIPNDQYVADSDLVVVRYGATAGAAPLGTLDGDQVYLRTATGSQGIDGGEILLGSDSALTAIGAGTDQVGTYNYGYKIAFYFLRPCSALNGSECSDGLSTLVRYSLDGETLVAEEIAEGVEQFQIEYGLDLMDENGDASKSDYVADVYRTADAVADWSEVVSARFHLIIRSELPDPTFTDNNTYYMFGDYSFEPDDDVINYRRKLFTKVVQLRNMSRG